MRLSKTCLIITSLSLFFIMALNLTGCTMRVEATDLMEGIVSNEVTPSQNLYIGNAVFSDFTTRLFQTTVSGNKNTLISPLSILYALAMTANGSDGETLEQFENVIGMSTDDLNLYLYSYLKNLPQENECKLSLANSVWFTDDSRFTVNRKFLQINADYYGAEIYQTAFDKSTAKNINNWVKQQTDDMIDKIADDVPADAIMYLVNALCFEAEWSKIYEKQQVKDGEFTNADGTVSKAEFMYGTEATYLQSENAQGFLKYYNGGEYAFVALLPDKDISVSDYIASLSAQNINKMLSEASIETVYTSIPKFETEYSTDMSAVLSDMGITNAFDIYKADFSRLGESTSGNIFISRALHKTCISVGEKGTKAGAVTVIETADGAALESPIPKEVYLNRPFIYMIVDCRNYLPLFIGTMMNI